MLKRTTSFSLANVTAIRDFLPEHPIVARCLECRLQHAGEAGDGCVTFPRSCAACRNAIGLDALVPLAVRADEDRWYVHALSPEQRGRIVGSHRGWITWAFCSRCRELAAPDAQPGEEHFDPCWGIGVDAYCAACDEPTVLVARVPVGIGVRAEDGEWSVLLLEEDETLELRLGLDPWREDVWPS